MNRLKRQKSRGANKKRVIFWGSIVLLIFVLALVGPYFTPHDPYKNDLSNVNQFPSREYIMGTDTLGRCIACRLVEGAFQSIFSAALVVIITFVVGTAIGILCGYFGGVVDIVVMRLVDSIQAFPNLIFTICAAALLGGGLMNCVLAMSLTGWTSYARLARSQVLALKEETFVSAAHISGMSTGKILVKTILPNSLRPLMVSASTHVGRAIINFSSLSFLGLGTALPYPEWGAMLNEARVRLQIAPWAAIFPGMAIFLVILIMGMFGDSLNEWLNPKKNNV